jgi:glycosyltransferase involved in cell wall biosynthesis
MQDVSPEITRARAAVSIETRVPFVSIIIPAYNVAPFIGETLTTVFAQTFTDFEVIIVNDGSPDTEEFERALQPYLDRICYLKQENRGASAARNTGLRAARGDLIAFLDADDLWSPNYLEEQIKFIREFDCDLACADAMIFGVSADAGRSYMDSLMGSAPPVGRVNFLELVNADRSLITSGVVVRRELVLEVGLFDEALRNAQDFDLWLRLARHGARLAYQRKVLLSYRSRANSLTGDAINSHQRELRVFDKIEQSYDLSPEEREQVLAVIRDRRALLEYELGKLYLLPGDFARAREAFAKANSLRRSWKTQGALWFARLAPRLMKDLYLQRTKSAKSGLYPMLFSLFLSLTLAGYANSQTPWAENRPAAGGGLVQLGWRPTASSRPTPAGSMRLTDSGSGLSRRVTVESTGLFRLVFEAGDNWGLSQWYDLVNDPSAQTNLTGPGYGVSHDISTAEPGLFQQVFYGTNPNDPKLYTRAASYYFPNSPRSFNVLENSPSRVVVQAISSPMVNAVGVLSNVTAGVTYYIYPNGKIYVHSVLRVTSAQTAGEWRCATLGLSDPTSGDPYTGPDSTGWIRSTTTQNPYQSVGAAESYIFAYWRASTTPAPYRNFTKASILLVPKPGNPNQGAQGRHNWPGWKRWYYGNVRLNMAAGQSLTQDYFIQLGTQGSSVLPNINSSAVADPIAQAYFANPTPPSLPRDADPTPTAQQELKADIP